MIPSKKSKEMEKALDALTQNMFGVRARTDMIAVEVCVTCGKKVGAFKDALSRKEYSISGMCQECQDSVFG